MTKYKLTISINKNVLDKARKHDINISSFLEIRLNEYIALLEGKARDDNYENIKSKVNNIIVRRGGDLNSRGDKSPRALQRFFNPIE
jgi:post-segregation antitoxin (ccd killing protein)